MTDQSKPLRLAMWSGPRNISTAMMRAWGNRRDTVVVDEPFYPFYLRRTGKDHPGAAEIMAQGETDWPKVVALLTGDLPTGKTIFFQKQMTHHLLSEIDRDWILQMTNCFLIRDPREVILSYIKKNSDPVLADLGFGQQREIFNFVLQSTKSVPPVVDADDVLRDPEKILHLLCDALGVKFDREMLYWPPGLRGSDGIWAKYWYDEVAKSTSFRPYQPREGKIPNRLVRIYEECCECYSQLYPHRLH